MFAAPVSNITVGQLHIAYLQIWIYNGKSFATRCLTRFCCSPYIVFITHASLLNDKLSIVKDKHAEHSEAYVEISLEYQLTSEEYVQ